MGRDSPGGVGFGAWYGTYYFDDFSVSSVALPDSADFDGSGTVDGKDFLIWQTGLGTGTTFAEGDANHSGAVDNADLAIWKGQFGTAPLGAVSSAIPEPSALLAMTLGSALMLLVARNRFAPR